MKEPITVGQVWITDAGNYFRVNAVRCREDQSMGAIDVTRIGCTHDGSDYLVRPTEHTFDASTFHHARNWRVVAHNASKFEQFLAGNAINAIAAR